jgi:chromosome condensin MukBEF ATPase and DNA-binding subunit MukB
LRVITQQPSQEGLTENSPLPDLDRQILTQLVQAVLQTAKGKPQPKCNVDRQLNELSAVVKLTQPERSEDRQLEELSEAFK